MIGIRGDDELNELCKNVIFPWSGVQDNIQKVLLPKKTKNKKNKQK